jgi:hypothetical protein
MSYGDFLGVVASGRKNVGRRRRKNVMPAFGDNPNVACYMDDLYVEVGPEGRRGAGRDQGDRHLPHRRLHAVGADPEGLFPAILGHEGAGIVVDVGRASPR